MNENIEVFEEGFNNSVSDNETVIPSDGLSDSLPDVPEDTLLDSLPGDSPERPSPGAESPEDQTEFDFSDSAFDTVSGSDVRTFPDSDFSVSGNDVPVSVSSGDIYNITVDMVPPEVPIWEKHIDDYTVTEGLLFLIFILLLFEFCRKLLKRD